jgi:hypothetical protein
MTGADATFPAKNSFGSATGRESVEELKRNSGDGLPLRPFFHFILSIQRREGTPSPTAPGRPGFFETADRSEADTTPNVN